MAIGWEDIKNMMWDHSEDIENIDWDYSKEMFIANNLRRYGNQNNNNRWAAITGWEDIDNFAWDCNGAVFPINLPPAYPAVKLDFSNSNCLEK